MQITRELVVQVVHRRSGGPRRSQSLFEHLESLVRGAAHSRRCVEYATLYQLQGSASVLLDVLLAIDSNVQERDCAVHT